MKLIHHPLTRKLAVAAIVFAIAAGSIFGQTSVPSSNPELAPAIKLLREREHKKARKLLNQAVKKNKDDGEAWYYLGLVNLRLSDFKKASEAFKKSIEVRPDLAAPAHAGYAYALVLQNRLDSATLQANKALELEPNNVGALYTLGIVDLRKGAREEAVRKADAVIALQPGFAAAYLLKSEAFVSYYGSSMYPISVSHDERQHRYKLAADALEQYLRLETDPRAADVWKEQLETLKFHAGVKADIYIGRDVTTKARLISKPTPSYTESARSEGIVGTVILRCVFAADGTVKHILVVQGLPNGLTERTIAAAKRIKFIPATREGKPVSMWMQLEYNFNLY